MSFIIKIVFVFALLLTYIYMDYHHFDFKKRKNGLKYMTSKTYLQPSFIFQSKEYKEFTYVK